MNETKSLHPDNHTPAAAAAQPANGVAAPALRWYVAIVAPRAEKSVRTLLTDRGIECYVATRNETHVWGRGQRRKVEAVIIPGVVFIRVPNINFDIFRNLPGIHSFLRDPAKKENPRWAIISDAEILALKRMLGQEDYDVEFRPSDFVIGEQVRVRDLDLGVLTAQVVHIPHDKTPYVGVRLNLLGCAYMKVPLERIEKLHP